MEKKSLGDRMKGYEAVAKGILVPRMPVILRIDGKAFHTFTKGFKKPCDEIISTTMKDTMKYLCEHVQGCVLGYTQSDEITLVLVDYKELNTTPWFDNEIQKLCSVGASMATMAFNRYFREHVDEWVRSPKLDIDYKLISKFQSTYEKALNMGAMFDCRCFNVPADDVTNCLLWRQNDATRNSIEALGRAYFSQKELYKKNGSNIQDMLHEKFSINWNDCSTEYKRGCCCIKNENGKWFIDTEIPIFKAEGRDYVEKLIKFEEI